MRTLILAGVLIALVATPALACRGTAEYPEAADDINGKISSAIRIRSRR